jgi:hypothetical protein
MNLNNLAEPLESQGLQLESKGNDSSFVVAKVHIQRRVIINDIIK